MRLAERLALVRRKTERAKKHLADLENEVGKFMQSNPYRLGTRMDSDSDKRLYYLTAVQDIPGDIVMTIGDVVHNLRCALDHLAHQLVLVGSPGKPVGRVQFPVFKDKASFEKAIKGNSIVNGASQGAIDAIKALEPYQGGNDYIWVISQLDNADKHRSILAVGSAMRSINNGMTMKAIDGQDVPVSLFVAPCARRVPLKVGDVLFATSDTEVNRDLKFTFEVAFGEPGLMEAQPVVPRLQEASNYTNELIVSFAKWLA